MAVLVWVQILIRKQHVALGKLVKPLDFHSSHHGFEPRTQYNIFVIFALMDITPNKFKLFLTYESVRQEIVFAPEGWINETIGQYKRDLAYFGLVRSLSLPLNFVLDGKDILRAAYAKYGIEAGVIFEVQERQDNPIWTFKTIFIGDLDFSEYNYDGIRVNITQMETGITNEFKAREDIRYEFPLVGDDIVNIVLPGVPFTEKSVFSPKFVDTSDLNINKRFTIGMDLITQGFNSQFLDALNTDQRNAADGDDFSGDAFVVGRRAAGVSTRFSGNLKGEVTSEMAFPFPNHQLRLQSTNGTIVYTFVNIVGGSTVPIPFDVDFDFEYTIADGEGLFLYSRATVPGSGEYLTVTEGNIDVSITAVSDQSNCKGIKAIDLGKRITSRVSPGTTFNSNLINSEWNNLIFTSGSAIRELEDAKIKISWKDYFETFKGIDDAGFGIDNDVARIEKGNFFMRNAEIMNIGNVSKCAHKAATELMFNKLKIGYNDGNTDEPEGLQEYNSGQQWELPITRVIREQSWVSPTRADQYGIEKLRVQFNITKQSTSDTDSDNDNFMIDCYLDGEDYKPILGATYTSVTGLAYPLTAYNLRLTPKKNLLRHGAYLASILPNGGYIEFGSADKNAELSTTDGVTVVKENQSVSVSSLNGRYFRPDTVEILAKLPKQAFDFMTSTPFGYIRFNFNDREMKGFIMDAPVELNMNSERTLKLLLTADSILP